MFTIKIQKTPLILTLFLSSAPLMAMDALVENPTSRTTHISYLEATGIPAGDEREKEHLRLISALALELEEDDKKSLEEYPLEQLRKLETAFRLVPFTNLTDRGNYFDAFLTYQGTNWNEKVTRFLESGFRERVADLCTILQWASDSLDNFIDKTLIITASLEIDKKVAVMTALASRSAELEKAGYVEELQRKVSETPTGDIAAMVEATRRMFFEAAREKFERLQVK